MVRFVILYQRVSLLTKIKAEFSVLTDPDSRDNKQ